LPEQRKESIIVAIYKKDDKTVCSHYRRASLSSNTYRLPFSYLFLSRLTPYVDEIFGDHECGFRRSYVTCCQILEKEWDQSETEHQLLMDFKENLLCGILTEFGQPVKTGT
jgi:hypothetical protein